MKSFGPFRLDIINHCVWRGEERMPLTPKAFDVLRYLVERAARLVTQDEILEGLWPETYVNPEGVRKYILEIRQVLGDRAKAPLFIQTVPKRGYQFIAKVTEEQTISRSPVDSEAALNVVGRHAGIAQLQRHYENAVIGQRQIVFVTGEAGVGKTTLVDVFQQRVASDAGPLFARGQCIEGFGGTEAYYPILEALASLVSRVRDVSLADTLAKLAPTWLAQFPSLVKPEQRDWLQREILGSTRGRMVREICEALEALTAKTPLILILEDLHWADASTLDFISAFARRREPAKLLLIGTYRPVDVILSQSPLKAVKEDLLVHRLSQEVAVERLEDCDVEEYLTKEFANNDFPPQLANIIHHNSGGNALFMVTIVRDILKRGVIVQDRGKWTLTAPIHEIYPGIPETLQQVLNAQFEQLSPDEQRVLESGSVAGERFSVWAASGMLDSSPMLTEETCDKLARRQQFIRLVGLHQVANGTVSPHYEFRHSLYRQALYRRLSSLDRSRLHLSLAEHLMPFCAAGKRHLASDLALHFEEGRDYERAARCLMLTAENASSRFSHRISIQILRRALELVSGTAASTRSALEIQILQRIGGSHHVLGEMQDAAAAYESAADRAAAADLKMLQLEALLRLTRPLMSFDATRGARICERAVEVSRSLADPLLLAQTELVAAGFRLLCDWSKVDEEALAHARETIRFSGGPTVLADASYELHVLAMQCEHPQALKQIDALIFKTTDPNAHMMLLGAKLNHLVRLGQFGDVLRIIKTGKMSAEKNGEHPWMFLLCEAWLQILCCDCEGLRRSSASLTGSEAGQYNAQARTVAIVAAGYAELYEEKYGSALECLTQVCDSRITPGFFLQWYWRLHARFGMAEAHLQAGDLFRARNEAQEFLESALSAGDPTMHALAWEINSRVASAAKDHDRARECIDKALAILDKFEASIVSWRVYRTAWDLCSQKGASLKAEEYRARAKEIIRRLENSFEPEEPLRESLMRAAEVRHILGQAVSA